MQATSAVVNCKSIVSLFRRAVHLLNCKSIESLSSMILSKEIFTSSEIIMNIRNIRTRNKYIKNESYNFVEVCWKSLRLKLKFETKDFSIHREPIQWKFLENQEMKFIVILSWNKDNKLNTSFLNISQVQRIIKSE